MPRQPSVVVIDDIASLRDVLGRGLERQGFNPVLLPCGVGAEEAVRDHQAVAVVTDLAMPERAGVDTIRGLREQYPELPIIALTGTPFEALALAAGATEVVAKPCSIEALGVQLSSCLGLAPRST